MTVHAAAACLLDHHFRPDSPLIFSESCSTQAKRAVFQQKRRYSKSEEIMHEDENPSPDNDRHFCCIEEATVVTAPFIRGHSLDKAPERLHLLAHAKADEKFVNGWDLQKEKERVLQKIHGLVFRGEGGLGDHSVKHWDWPLGEHGSVQIFGNDKTFEAHFDFRPFGPDEIWAKMMGDELVVHCVSKTGQRGRELLRAYTLPLNTDARTARFRIKDGHTLVVTAQKEQPLLMNVVAAVRTSTPRENQSRSDAEDKNKVHAEYRHADFPSQNITITTEHF